MLIVGLLTLEFLGTLSLLLSVMLALAPFSLHGELIITVLKAPNIRVHDNIFVIVSNNSNGVDEGGSGD